MRPIAFALFLCGIGLSGPVAAQVPLPPLPVPQGNPVTPEKARLGMALFWDEQLSATLDVACGTCHLPEYGGSDERSAHLPEMSTHPGSDDIFGSDDDVIGSPGVIRSTAEGFYDAAEFFGLDPQVTGRKAPSVINAAFAPALFWDGRAGDRFVDPVSGQIVLLKDAALESQAVGPPVSDVEMGHVGITWPEIAARIEGRPPLALATDIPADLAAFIDGKAYRDLFEIAFGTADVTPARIAMAIASYERTLVSDQAKIDEFPVGFTPQELVGADLFDTAARCNLCHPAPLFTDHSFRNIGLRPASEDAGLGAITGDPDDDGRFKVPSLRNVDLRSPFFHNGQFETLEEVVDFYDRGGDFTAGQDPDIVPLGLTSVEKDALVAYVETFTDERVHFRQAPFDRPTLYSESDSVPRLYGEATAASDGILPRAIAVQPPTSRNKKFTVGMKNGVGGSRVILVVAVEPAYAGLPLVDATLYLDLWHPYSVYLAGPLEGNGAGNGYTSLVFDLEELGPEVFGLTVFGQWLLLEDLGQKASGLTGSGQQAKKDPLGPGSRLYATEAFTFTVF